MLYIQKQFSKRDDVLCRGKIFIILDFYSFLLKRVAVILAKDLYLTTIVLWSTNN